MSLFYAVRWNFIFIYFLVTTNVIVMIYIIISMKFNVYMGHLCLLVPNREMGLFFVPFKTVQPFNCFDSKYTFSVPRVSRTCTPLEALEYLSFTFLIQNNNRNAKTHQMYSRESSSNFFFHILVTSSCSRNHRNCYHSTALALKLWTKLHIVCNTVEDVCTADDCWGSFKILFLADVFVINICETEHLHYFMAIGAWNCVSDNDSRIWDYIHIFLTVDL